MADPFATLTDAERAEYERWLDSLPLMSDADRVAEYESYARTETLSGKDDEIYPHLVA